MVGFSPPFFQWRFPIEPRVLLHPVARYYPFFIQNLLQKSKLSLERVNE